MHDMPPDDEQPHRADDRKQGNDHVVESHCLLHTVVKQPLELAARQHVFWFGIHFQCGNRPKDIRQD